MERLTSPKEFIHILKEEGVLFQINSEQDAEKFLRNNNYYYKLASFKHNYHKCTEGPQEGKYINLDFEYLRDLSTIDMRLRFFMMNVTLDIEHYLKVYILKLLDQYSEDGNNVVIEFYNSGSKSDQKQIMTELTHQLSNEYTGQLLEGYGLKHNSVCPDCLPTWAFLEVISFGQLNQFYNFVLVYLDIDDEFDFTYTNSNSKTIDLLSHVNKVRNASAHGNCILNNLSKSDNAQITDIRINRMLQAAGIDKTNRDQNMNNIRINQLTSTMFVFDTIVTSIPIKKYIYEEFAKLIKRFELHKDYYNDNEHVRSTFDFFHKLSDHLLKSVSVERR